MPLRRRSSTWSFIKAIKGEITKVNPDLNMAGSW